MGKTVASTISLAGAKVLIVEDEPFIALDIFYSVEQAGGIPVGPATTVAEALKLLETIRPDGAIVDVNLPDGTIGPVLKVLCPEVPVVVHSGVGLPDVERQAHPNLEVFNKPTSPALLVLGLGLRGETIS